MNQVPDQYIKRVVVIGPECTGKSDLAEFLGQHFKTTWVPEYAREYLNNLDRPYTESDLLQIARGQLTLENAAQAQASNVVICDTNLYVIKVWSEYKFGRCDREILSAIAGRKYDLYLLTYIDIPWQFDPLREHPDKRQELYEIYWRELSQQSVPVVDIRGDREQRRRTAVEAVEKLLRTKI